MNAASMQNAPPRKARPPLSLTRVPFDRRGSFRRHRIARVALLDFFQAELHLIFGQRFGATTKAMTLHC